VRLAASVLIRAGWSCSRERRTRLLARTLAIIDYHQANIAAAAVIHAKARRKRLRLRGVARGSCIRCGRAAL
jgi:hypothetical protein